MELKLAIAKVDKYGAENSGDTVEVIERLNGGISIVLGDGQIDGRNKKYISNIVSHRVIEHISSGVSDGAAIRSASNSIFLEFNGRVQANLNVISVDLQTNRIILLRNTPAPIFLIDNGNVDCLTAASEPIGGRENISPSIIELQIEPDMAIIAFSDGVMNAGRNLRQDTDICLIIETLIDEEDLSARQIAELLLTRAIRLDNDRPQDNMSVIVLMISPLTTDNIRRINVSLSLDEA